MDAIQSWNVWQMHSISVQSFRQESPFRFWQRPCKRGRNICRSCIRLDWRELPYRSSSDCTCFVRPLTGHRLWRMVSSYWTSWSSWTRSSRASRWPTFWHHLSMARSSWVFSTSRDISLSLGYPTCLVVFWRIEAASIYYRLGRLGLHSERVRSQQTDRSLCPPEHVLCCTAYASGDQQRARNRILRNARWNLCDVLNNTSNFTYFQSLCGIFLQKCLRVVGLQAQGQRALSATCSWVMDLINVNIHSFNIISQGIYLGYLFTNIYLHAVAVEGCLSGTWYTPAGGRDVKKFIKFMRATI